MLPWKQTAKNGACFFKLSIPSHRFLTLLQKLQGMSARPGMTMWLIFSWDGRAEITLATAELQNDRPIVSVGEKATERKHTAASMQAQGSNKLWTCPCLPDARESRKLEEGLIFFSQYLTGRIMRFFMWKFLIYMVPREQNAYFSCFGCNEKSNIPVRE